MAKHHAAAERHLLAGGGRGGQVHHGVAREDELLREGGRESLGRRDQRQGAAVLHAEVVHVAGRGQRDSCVCLEHGVGQQHQVAAGRDGELSVLRRHYKRRLIQAQEHLPPGGQRQRLRCRRDGGGRNVEVAARGQHKAGEGARRGAKGHRGHDVAGFRHDRHRLDGRDRPTEHHPGGRVDREGPTGRPAEVRRGGPHAASGGHGHAAGGRHAAQQVDVAGGGEVDATSGRQPRDDLFVLLHLDRAPGGREHEILPDAAGHDRADPHRAGGRDRHPARGRRGFDQVQPLLQLARAVGVDERDRASGGGRLRHLAHGHLELADAGDGLEGQLASNDIDLGVAFADLADRPAGLDGHAGQCGEEGTCGQAAVHTDGVGLVGAGRKFARGDLSDQDVATGVQRHRVPGLVRQEPQVDHDQVAIGVDRQRAVHGRHIHRQRV